MKGFPAQSNGMLFSTVAWHCASVYCFQFDAWIDLVTGTGTEDGDLAPCVQQVETFGDIVIDARTDVKLVIGESSGHFVDRYYFIFRLLKLLKILNILILVLNMALLSIWRIWNKRFLVN